MFWFFGSKNKVKRLEEDTRKSFQAVKNDLEGFTKWIKHLNERDKQLFDLINEVQREMTSVNDEISGIKEAISFSDLAQESKQVLKKTAVLGKQEAVYSVEKTVQTPVQTGNFYDILQNLTSNERLVVLTLMNTEMRLSYEDLARLLGKERSTIRGQINAIKQKSESLIEEMVEPNGKKRVYIREEVKEKLQKYAKVRVKGERKGGKSSG